jgi:hypothetical protein
MNMNFSSGISPRQNLLASFERKNTAWIPWIPYIGGVNTPVFVPQEIKQRQDFVEIGCFLQDYLGCDILIDANALQTHHKRGIYRSHRQGNLLVEEYEIDGYVLTRTHRYFWYGDQATSAIEKYPVNAVEDLKVFDAWLADQSVSVDWQKYLEKSTRLGERGLVYTNGPRTPIMALLIDHMGLENFITLLSDFPAPLEALMERMHANNLESYRSLAECGVKVVGTFDDFDTSLISPAMFSKYVLPCLKEYTAILHQADKLHMVHSCGHVRHFLKGCLDIGYDAHNYLTAPPTGNTPLCDARAAWGERINIMASVDPVLMETGTPEQVQARTHQMLDELGSRRAMMIMTSSKPTVPEANLRAVAQVIRN